MDRPEDRIALIELQGRDGRIARVIDIARWPVTLGRGLDNQIVIDDPHVAAMHAVLDADEAGRVTLQVGDSRNGARLDGLALAAGMRQPVPPEGALIQLGATQMRLRLRGEPLEPERALVQKGARATAQLAMLAALMLLTLAARWISLDPGAEFEAWLPILVGAPLALALWCSLWALASKLFQHRFDIWGHSFVALSGLLAIGLADMLLPQISATLGWPWLWQLRAPIVGALGAALLWRHLRHVVPQPPRLLVGGLVLGVLLLGGETLIANLRIHDRWIAAPYMSTLPLATLRWGRSESSEKLVGEMAPLREGIARRVRKARSEDADDSVAAEEDDS